MTEITEWKHVYSYLGDYTLQERFNEQEAEWEFKVIRHLGNLPLVKIERLDLLESKSEQVETFIRLGYQYQFVIFDDTPPSLNQIQDRIGTLGGLRDELEWLRRTEKALICFQHELARVRGIWVH